MGSNADGFNTVRGPGTDALGRQDKKPRPALSGNRLRRNSRTSCSPATLLGAGATAFGQQIRLTNRARQGMASQSRRLADVAKGQRPWTSPCEGASLQFGPSQTATCPGT
jgi:hypothetical protein